MSQVGGFFIVNLFLAVLFDEFMKAQAFEKAVQAAKARAAAKVLRKKERLERLEREKAERKAKRRAKSRTGSGATSGGYSRDTPTPNGLIDGRETPSTRPTTPAQIGAPTVGDDTKQPLLGEGALRSDEPEAPSPRLTTFVPVRAKLPPPISTEDDEEVVVGCCEPAGCCGWCGCDPKPDTWRAALSAFANSALIGNISTGLVVVNVVLMCMPYAGMRKEYAAHLTSPWLTRGTPPSLPPRRYE